MLMSRKRPATRTGSATQPALWAGAIDEPAGAAGPSCPVQPERDVRSSAQRGQITWGGSTSTQRSSPITWCVRSPPSKLDLRGLYADVRARGEIAGAPATDPKIIPAVATDEALPRRARSRPTAAASSTSPPTAPCGPVRRRDRAHALSR
jgi:hypothetical protein